MATLPRIQVLLASFDGAAFLAAQLDSLAAQSGVDWRLLWRDDGSRDGTVSMLQGFAAAHPGRVARLADGRGRLGPTGSFWALLEAADPAHPVAFMDQDDVWQPGKLAAAVAALAGAEATCGRLALVDAALRPLGLSALPGFPPGFASLLAHNVAAGCTMALSPRGRALALAAPPPPGTAHDWWAALLVTGQGGRLVFDAEPRILYRQHGGNAVGGAGGFWGRARRALARGAVPPEGLRRLPAHLRALRAVPLAPEPARAAAILAGLPGAPPWRRLALAREAGFRHHDPRGALWLRLWLLAPFRDTAGA